MENVKVTMICLLMATVCAAIFYFGVIGFTALVNSAGPLGVEVKAFIKLFVFIGLGAVVIIK